MKIYNLGSLNIDYVYSVDHFVSAGETLASTTLNTFPGGKGLNQSVALARAGAKVIHGALLGENGEFLIKTLADSDVCVDRIEKIDGSCGHAIIQVDRNGQNCILLFGGSNHRLNRQYVERFLADAQKGDILLLQNEVNALDLIFEIAKEKQLQIAFNPSPYHESIQQLPLSNVKWWFCNEIEGEALFGNSDPEQIAENFSKKYPESGLILTLGKRGSMYKDKTQKIYQGIYRAKPVDTTAAGDTFSGYFMAAIASGKSAREALDLASKASTLTISRAGASESIPYLDEVLNTPLIPEE